MTFVQVFRALLTLIAAPGCPKFALRAAEADAATPSIADHAASSPCVALDSSQFFNALAGVPECAWRAVQSAAACTLTALSGAMGLSGATISPLFRPSKCPTLTYDATVRVDVPAAAAGELFGADASWSACAATKAEALLKNALSDRALEVAVMQLAVEEVPVSAKGGFSGLPGVTSAGLLVGVVFNALEVRAFAWAVAALPCRKACVSKLSLFGSMVASDMNHV
jgi:hypothetical protein